MNRNQFLDFRIVASASTDPDVVDARDLALEELAKVEGVVGEYETAATEMRAAERALKRAQIRVGEKTTEVTESLREYRDKIEDVVDLLGGEKAVSVPPGLLTPLPTAKKLSLYAIWTLGTAGGREAHNAFLEDGEPDENSDNFITFKEFKKNQRLEGLGYHEDTEWMHEGEDEQDSFFVDILDHGD